MQSYLDCIQIDQISCGLKPPLAAIMSYFSCSLVLIYPFYLAFSFTLSSKIIKDILGSEQPTSMKLFYRKHTQNQTADTFDLHPLDGLSGLFQSNLCGWECEQSPRVRL